MHGSLSCAAFTSNSGAKMQAPPIMCMRQRKASATSNLAMGPGNHGNLCCHHTDALAKSLCRGCAAGGWPPLGQCALGIQPPQMRRPLPLGVL